MNKGFLCILFATIFFSSMEIVLKVGCASFHPLQITFLRFFIGAIILIPFAMKEMKRRGVIPSKKDLAFFAIQGFVVVVISMIFFQMAVIYGHASVVAVLFCSNPVFITIFAYFILHQPVTKMNLLSLLFSIVGIVCIMNPANMGEETLGIVFMLLSAITFAFYAVVGETRTGYGAFGRTCLSFLLGSLELLVLILLTNTTPVANFLASIGMEKYAYTPSLTGINSSNILALLYVGICVTGLGYTFYFLVMQDISPAMASLVFFIKPVLATAMAYFFINDPIKPNMILGIGFLLGGSLITLVPKLKKSETKK